MNYKGKGKHSINELEQICEYQKESLHVKQLKNQNLRRQRDELLDCLLEVCMYIDSSDVKEIHKNKILLMSKKTVDSCK